jgi:hypothetical protein
LVLDAEKMDLNVAAVPVEQFGCFAWFEPGGGGEESSHGVAFGPGTWRWVARCGHVPVSPPCASRTVSEYAVIRPKVVWATSQTRIS